MDLEMTGLEPSTDVIVEIATLVTDDELKVLLVNTDSDASYEIHRGDRIAQLVVQRVEAATLVTVGALSGENRGGGFGHTGR